MRKIQDLLHGYQTIKESKDNPIIELLLRRGAAIPLKTPQTAENMVCQDCSSKEGYHCLHDGKHAWFCGNLECLRIDTQITKERARKIWWAEFHKQQSDSKKSVSWKNSRDKEWDGK